MDDEGSDYMARAASGEPARVIIAGDWHGNTDWAGHVIRMAGEMLAAEPVRILVHLGDFGFWGSTAGYAYLEETEASAVAAGLRILALRGNHEDPAVVEDFSVATALPDDPLVSLPDGLRWTWHGRTWVAAGGAVSPDRIQRVQGVSWFPEEELSGEAAERIAGEGRADVLVSHDVGSAVSLALGPWPSGWHLSDLTRGEAHRQRVQRVADALQPRYWMHGHYHRNYQRTQDMGWGPVRVTGFNMDGTDSNWAVLDTRTMEWENPGE